MRVQFDEFAQWAKKNLAKHCPCTSCEVTYTSATVGFYHCSLVSESSEEHPCGDVPIHVYASFESQHQYQFPTHSMTLTPLTPCDVFPQCGCCRWKCCRVEEGGGITLFIHQSIDDRKGLLPRRPWPLAGIPWHSA